MVCRLCHRQGVQQSRDMFLGVVAQNETDRHRAQFHPGEETEFVQVYAKKIKQNKPEVEVWGLEGGITKDPNKVYKYASRRPKAKSDQNKAKTVENQRIQPAVQNQAYQNVPPHSTSTVPIVQQKVQHQTPQMSVQHQIVSPQPPQTQYNQEYRPVQMVKSPPMMPPSNNYYHHRMQSPPAGQVHQSRTFYPPNQPSNQENQSPTILPHSSACSVVRVPP